MGQATRHRIYIFMVQFYRSYPALLSSEEILYAVRRELTMAETGGKNAVLRTALEKSKAGPRKSWKPGLLHPNLSWTHYRMLLKLDEINKRAFYEIEAIKNSWSARELERQIASLLYERLALSRDKQGLMRLAAKGHEVQKPADVFKDPMVIEFLGLPESPKLVETKLEQALIGNLQAFLLELGKGFALVARQERLTIDGDHFYIDLVFYHTALKCYIIIASRYKLHLSSEAELRAELRRGVKALSGPLGSPKFEI